MKDIEDKLAAFLMDYGVLKNADADKMAKRIAGMFEKEREELRIELDKLRCAYGNVCDNAAITEKERAQLAAKYVEIMESIRAEADRAYCFGCEISKRTECLGEDIKLERGIFGKAELEAHKLAAEYFGFYKLVLQFLRNHSSDCGKGWLSPEKAERLRGYAAHRPNCTIMDFPAGSKPCNCGLSEAMEETK